MRSNVCIGSAPAQLITRQCVFSHSESGASSRRGVRMGRWLWPIMPQTWPVRALVTTFLPAAAERPVSQVPTQPLLTLFTSSRLWGKKWIHNTVKYVHVRSVIVGQIGTLSRYSYIWGQFSLRCSVVSTGRSWAMKCNDSWDKQEIFECES